MAKDPAFLFYPGDFTTGTQFFTDEQVGKYIRLLMAQHQLGHLEEKHMIMICKTYDKDVFSKFIKDSEGLYFNERLEDEILKRQKYSESRSKNRLSKNNISSTYVQHMENTNINSNNINMREAFFESIRVGSEIEVICTDLKKPKDFVLAKLEAFRSFAEVEYPSYQKFVFHFKNWLRKNMNQVTDDKPRKRNQLL
jgi:uncharacterized protein YdaU (DUF1376 family)